MVNQKIEKGTRYLNSSIGVYYIMYKNFSLDYL